MTIFLRSAMRLMGIGRVVVLAAVVVALAAPVALPGAPSVPSAVRADDVRPAAAAVTAPPTPVYFEDFEDFESPSTPGLLAPQPVTTAFPQVSANPIWLNTATCNGIWLDGAPYVGASYGGCDNVTADSSYALLRSLATALGDGDAKNHAVSSFTSMGVDPGAGHVQLLSPPVAVTPNRYYTASVRVANVNCYINPASMQFFIQTSASVADGIPAGSGRQVLGSAVSGCPAGALPDLQVGTLSSPGSIRWTAASIRMGIINQQASGSGNDAAIDDFALSDATPQLGKAFSPALIAPGDVSTLTFTVTNTSELASKVDWGFTDSLPTGVVVAPTPRLGGTCASTTGAALTRTATGSTVTLTGGDLASGQTSCTVTVDVTSAAEGTYVNGPANVTTDFLAPPSNATLVVRAPRLTLTKAMGSHGRVSDGDQFTTAIHTGSATGPVVSPTAASTTTGSGTTVTAGTGTTGTYVADGRSTYQLTESAAGTADLTKYSSSITCSDSTGRQTGLPTGQAFTTSFAITPVAGADIACVLTNDAVPAALTVSKASSPASGTAIPAGGSASYTLTFRNTGGRPIAVDHDDVLTDVLDDADVSAVTTSNPALSTNLFGGRLSVTGTVPPGATYTVGYTVTVPDPAKAGGNGVINNYLVADGQSPPTSCVPATGLCTTHPIPGTVSVDKAASVIGGGPAQPGDQVTYTLTFTHAGGLAAAVDYVDDLSDVLDDATLTSGPKVSSPALAAALTGTAPNRSIRVTGSIPAGAPVTVSYTVLVDSSGFGDATLANCVKQTAPGADQDCATTAVPGHLEVSKTSDPASGTPVLRDSTITYTLRFANTGGRPVTVDHTDDLSGVLDDAAVETAPVATGGLTVTPSPLGSSTTFDISGSLAGGASATVTYTVKVKTSGFGDRVLENFLVAAGDPPHVPCASTPTQDPTCTTHPVASALAVSKTSDPASTLPVVPGQVVTYSVTFANGGGGLASVDHTDSLAKLLDDADLVAGSLTAGGGLHAALAADGRSIWVTGDVAGGDSSTATYQVRVKATGFGDGRLDNFVRATGTPPPVLCETDDAMCTTHPVPADLHVRKSSDPASGTDVRADGLISYTLSFTNTGGQDARVDHTDDLSEALDDATVEGGPTITGDAHGLTVSGVSGDAFAVTGDLEAGTATLVTYTLRVKGSHFGDGVLTNYLVKTGDTPPTTCVLTDPLCTEHHVASRLEVVKTTDPSDGSPVAPGADVHYTLTFRNTGGSAATVDHTDHLAGLLDDAKISSGPVASNAALQVDPSPLGAATSFTVAGSVPAETTYTVSYTATVKTSGFGDGVLTNVVVAGDGDPGECLSGDPLCTENPVAGRLDVVKTSDPAPGADAPAGSDVTYTLTFSNTGGSAVDVDQVDTLAGVLDDADLTAGPTATSPLTAALSTGGDSLAVTGRLPAESRATVTYTVTVKQAGFGDGSLFNVVRPKGETPPTSCDDHDTSCTVHPVPGRLTVAKTSDAADGQTVKAGDPVTYSVTFSNTGGSPIAVDHTDHLDRVLDDARLTTPRPSTGRPTG